MMRETTVDDAVVIHVNSLAGERLPFVPGISVYPASKRAVTGLAQNLRHELAGTRIRVSVKHSKYEKAIHLHNETINMIFKKTILRQILGLLTVFCYTQSISPGLVATEFMASYSIFSAEAMMAMPTLNPDDVVAAAIYILSNPPHVLVYILYISLNISSFYNKTSN